MQPLADLETVEHRAVATPIGRAIPADDSCFVRDGHLQRTSSLAAALGHWARFTVLVIAVHLAYDIRLYAVREYGRIIHEFDPWFNFRATQYLADNGWAKFSKWFDYMSWYPLGRPVGTTIYPGMQVTAVAIWKSLGALGEGRQRSTTSASSSPRGSARLPRCSPDCSPPSAAAGQANAVVAALVMAIVPAHTMRSVAGGYDNESLAVTGMCLTFFIWCRARCGDRNRGGSARSRVWPTSTWWPPGADTRSCSTWSACTPPSSSSSALSTPACTKPTPSSGSSALSAPCSSRSSAGPNQIRVEQLGPAGVFLGYQVLEVRARRPPRRSLGSGRVAPSGSLVTALRRRCRAHRGCRRRSRPRVGSVLCPCACAGSSSSTPRRVTPGGLGGRAPAGLADAYWQYLHARFTSRPRASPWQRALRQRPRPRRCSSRSTPSWRTISRTAWCA